MANVKYKSNTGGDATEASPLRRFIPNRAALAHAITVEFSVSVMPLFSASGYKSHCSKAAYTRYKRWCLVHFGVPNPLSVLFRVFETVLIFEMRISEKPS